jgi:hypothetical protein
MASTQSVYHVPDIIGNTIDVNQISHINAAKLKRNELLKLIASISRRLPDSEWKRLGVPDAGISFHDRNLREDLVKKFISMRTALQSKVRGNWANNQQVHNIAQAPRTNWVLTSSTEGRKRNTERTAKYAIGRTSVTDFTATALRFDPTGNRMLARVNYAQLYGLPPPGVDNAVYTRSVNLEFDKEKGKWFVVQGYSVDSLTGAFEADYTVDEFLNKALAEGRITEVTFVKDVPNREQPAGAGAIEQPEQSDCLFDAIEKLTNKIIEDRAALRAKCGIEPGPIFYFDIHQLEDMFGVGINIIHNTGTTEEVLTSGKPSAITVRLCGGHYLPVIERQSCIDSENFYTGERNGGRKPLTVAVYDATEGMYRCFSLERIATDCNAYRLVEKLEKRNKLHKMEFTGESNKWPRTVVIAPPMLEPYKIIKERLDYIHQHSSPTWSPYLANTRYVNLNKPQDIAYSWWRATLKQPIRTPSELEAAIAGNAFTGGLIQAARTMYAGPGAKFDVTSCYAAVMKLPMPVGTPTLTESELYQDIPHDRLPHGFYTIVSGRDVIECERPSRFRYSHGGVYAAPEVIEMKKRNYPIQMLGPAMVYPSSEMSTTIFTEFINAAFLLKQNAAADPSISPENKKFAKMIVTSLWGQLGKRSSDLRKNVDDLKDYDHVVTSKKDRSHDFVKVNRLDRPRYSRLPNIAAYVTSYGRCLLNLYADAVTNNDRSALLEFATDGFIATKWDPRHEDNSKATVLGQLRFEGKGYIQYDSLFNYRLTDENGTATCTAKWSKKYGDS